MNSDTQTAADGPGPENRFGSRQEEFGFEFDNRDRSFANHELTCLAVFKVTRTQIV